MSDKKLSPPSRADFMAFEDVQSRWMDNDAYGHINNVKFEVAIFKNDDDIASAAGHFVHVYVDRKSNKSTPIPQNVRTLLEGLVKADYH